jgi:hypothetical protein
MVTVEPSESNNLQFNILLQQTIDYLSSLGDVMYYVSIATPYFQEFTMNAPGQIDLFYWLVTNFIIGFYPFSGNESQQLNEALLMKLPNFSSTSQRLTIKQDILLSSWVNMVCNHSFHSPLILVGF